jgi:dienelactone hydrolase
MVSEPSEPVLQVDPDEKRPKEPGRGHRVRSRLSRFWQSLQPGPRARKGAAWGVAVTTALVAAIVGIWLQPGLGPVLDVPAGMLLALLFGVGIGLGLILALKLLGLLPRFFGWIGLGAVGVLIFLGLEVFGLPPGLSIATALGIAIVEAFLGGALILLFGREALRPARRRALWGVVLAALAVNVWLVWWLAQRGDTEHLVKARRPDPVRVAPVAAADPSQPGPYKVLSLTYGSGTDRQRPEFGRDADLKTPSVDATPFVEGNEGWRVGVRDWFWGFDFKKFPRNGRVWYPEGPGPFPLVLVVHGNHNMVDFSDPGYAWIAELLASRGFITVSVDENFFNGSWVGGLEKENDGRGWMLLKHLEVWRHWNRTPGNPFHRKVAMDRIALIGHSRGGEAAGIAAAFNRLPRYPDDATVPLGFNFGIRGVVAIAPSDGQYKPANKPIPASDVSYLVLQGGHDGDVSAFAGERFYRRLEFEKGRHFKTALYSYRSNHGQWNTTWGDTDAGWPQSLILNRKALLTAEEQRRLGAVAISAFLEATLRDNPAYIRLFRDLRSARGWLPEDLYITRFQDSTFRALVDSEEDVDVTTATLEEARIEGKNLTLWKQKDLAFRQGEGTKQNQVVYLGWKRVSGKPGPAATYAVRLPQGPSVDEEGDEWKPPGQASLLVFSLADSGDEAPDPKEKGKKKEKSDAEKEKEEKEREARKEKDRKEGKEPLDLSIELVSAGGATVRLPLSRFRAVPVPLESRFTRLPDESDVYGDAWEPVLQTFELPLQAFASAKPGFDPAALREIRFVFDRSPEGVVILDDVGFAKCTPATTC